MSKKAKVQSSNTASANEMTQVSNSISSGALPLLFSKKNYQLMLIGLGVIFLGFILMMGKNNDIDGASIFPAEDIYSARRIILAPIVIVIGFLIELYAIVLVKKNS
jgi:hypothetical protein